MKIQYFSQVITGEPLRSFCTLVLCNKALVNVLLQIVHTYKHKHAHINMDRFQNQDISPSPLLDDTTRSGEP